MDKDLFERGLAQRKATLGAEYVEKNLAAADDFTRPFQEAMTAWCWGFGWGDDAIDSLLVFSLLLSHSFPSSLRFIFPSLFLSLLLLYFFIFFLSSVETSYLFCFLIATCRIKNR